MSPQSKYWGDVSPCPIWIDAPGWDGYPSDLQTTLQKKYYVVNSEDRDRTEQSSTQRRFYQWAVAPEDDNREGRVIAELPSTVLRSTATSLDVVRTAMLQLQHAGTAARGDGVTLPFVACRLWAVLGGINDTCIMIHVSWYMYHDTKMYQASSIKMHYCRSISISITDTLTTYQYHQSLIYSHWYFYYCSL